MDQAFTTIAAALVGGSIATLLGAFFQRRRDKENEKRKTALEHYKRQIEQLYAPLLCLLQQSYVVHEIAKEVLPLGDDGQLHPETFGGESRKIWLFFTENYFLPLNAKIRDLLDSNYYLLEGRKLPPSFEKFIEHEAQFRCLYKLWKDEGMTVPPRKARDYPRGIDDEVKTILTGLQRRYHSYLQDVKEEFPSKADTPFLPSKIEN